MGGEGGVVMRKGAECGEGRRGRGGGMGRRGGVARGETRRGRSSRDEAGKRRWRPWRIEVRWPCVGVSDGELLAVRRFSTPKR